MGSEVMDSLRKGSVAIIRKFLMDSMDDGSVVTWKMILVSDTCELSSLCVTG